MKKLAAKYEADVVMTASTLEALMQKYQSEDDVMFAVIVQDIQIDGRNFIFQI